MQNIFRKIKKSSKVRQNQKLLISVFTYFLSTSAKCLFLQGRLGTKSPRSFGIFLIFLYFLRSKPYGKSWCDLYKKFPTLDIKFRFTCDDRKLYWNFVKFPNIMSRIVGTHFPLKTYFSRNCYYFQLTACLVLEKCSTLYRNFPFGSPYSLPNKNNLSSVLTLRKTLHFHLISWYGNFVRKLCLSTKFPYQKIRWKHSILRSVRKYQEQWDPQISAKGILVKKSEQPCLFRIMGNSKMFFWF